MVRETVLEYPARLHDLSCPKCASKEFDPISSRRMRCAKCRSMTERNILQKLTANSAKKD